MAPWRPLEAGAGSALLAGRVGRQGTAPSWASPRPPRALSPDAPLPPAAPRPKEAGSPVTPGAPACQAAGGGAAGSSTASQQRPLSKLARREQLPGVSIALRRGRSPLLASGRAPGSCSPVSPPAEDLAAGTAQRHRRLSRDPLPPPAGTDPAASAAGFPALKADLNGLAGGRVVLWPVPHVPGPRPSSWSASRHPRVHPQAPRALPRRRASVQPQERRRASRRASARLSQPCSSGRPRGQGQTVSRRSDSPRRQRAGKRLVSRPRLPQAWPAVPAVVTLAGPLWPGPVASPYLALWSARLAGRGEAACPLHGPLQCPRPGACGPEHSPGLPGNSSSWPPPRTR